MVSVRKYRFAASYLIRTSIKGSIYSRIPESGHFIAQTTLQINLEITEKRFPDKR